MLKLKCFHFVALNSPRHKESEAANIKHSLKNWNLPLDERKKQQQNNTNSLATGIIAESDHVSDSSLQFAESTKKFTEPHHDYTSRKS